MSTCSDKNVTWKYVWAILSISQLFHLVVVVHYTRLSLWRITRKGWGELQGNQVSRSRALHCFIDKIASSMMATSSSSNAIILTENDIPGASLLGRKPEELSNSELKFWLKCRGDTGKGLKTKAELVKRVYDYIKRGKDKEIVDPDPHEIYSRRKEKQTTSSDLIATTVKNWWSFLALVGDLR